MPVTAQDLYDKLDEIDAETKKLVDKMEETNSKWWNRLYGPLVRILSIVALGLAFYCAFVGLAGSALVMVFLFLTTWFLYLLGHFGTEIAKGMYESKVREERNKVNTRVRLT